VCSVLTKLKEKGLVWDEAQGNANLTLLKEPHEETLLVTLSRYPEVLESAALGKDPQQLANYLRELANAFHTYYNEHRVLVDHADLRNARLNLSLAVRQVLHNGLQLLGVSAPEAM
jgi:arginyl-tRNA synthetase